MSRMSRSSGGRRPRRRFSDEFKQGAVRLVLDEGKTVGAVARELDLTQAEKTAERPVRLLYVSHPRGDPAAQKDPPPRTPDSAASRRSCSPRRAPTRRIRND